MPARQNSTRCCTSARLGTRRCAIASFIRAKLRSRTSSASSPLPPSARTAGQSDASMSVRLAARSVGNRSAEPRPVAGERAGRLRGVTVACLCHDAADPTLHLFGRFRRGRDPPPEIHEELSLPIGQHREQQCVLRWEMAVERLIRQTRLLDDRSDLRVDAALAPHDNERGVDEAARLGRIRRSAVRRRPGPRWLLQPRPKRTERRSAQARTVFPNCGEVNQADAIRPITSHGDPRRCWSCSTISARWI